MAAHDRLSHRSGLSSPACHQPSVESPRCMEKKKDGRPSDAITSLYKYMIVGLDIPEIGTGKISDPSFAYKYSYSVIPI